jgi:4-hydroxybenzoate polyprenyltransferase
MTSDSAKSSASNTPGDSSPKPGRLPWLRAIRPKQWLKNLLLFSGIFLNIDIYATEGRLWLGAAAGFGIFCLLSGSVYLINDILDVERDRHHPKKRKRPIAAGEISIPAAWAYAGVLMAGSLAGASFLGPRFLVCSAAYWLLVLAYSLKLKHMVLIDVLALAMGFVLRAMAGLYAIWEPAVVIFSAPPRVTPWFLVCTMFLALFIALCKRRSEIAKLGDNTQRTRAVLREYPLPVLDQLISVSVSCCLVTYSLYCVLEHREIMLVTLPFVIFGVGRYLLHLYRDNEGGAPEQVILGDPALIANVVLWLIAVASILILSGK